MKVLKWMLIASIALLLTAFISTFFMSENFRVSQSQVIKAPPEAVFNQLATLKNWENWSYWNTLDDKMTTTYNDIPSGVGAGYSWKSKKSKVGNGTLRIIEAQTNVYVKVKLKMDGQRDAFAEYILKPVEGGTELTSALNNKTNSVFGKLMTRLLMKPMMKKAFKASATSMETYLLNNPTNAGAAIDSVPKSMAKKYVIAKK